MRSFICAMQQLKIYKGTVVQRCLNYTTLQIYQKSTFSCTVLNKKFAGYTYVEEWYYVVLDKYENSHKLN